MSRSGQPVIATASADHTARVWGVDSGRCLLQYTGHSGSVNSVRFHPMRDLILTASGDNSAHVWQAAVNWDLPKRPPSAEDLTSSSDRNTVTTTNDDQEDAPVLRTPIKVIWIF